MIFRNLVEDNRLPTRMAPIPCLARTARTTPRARTDACAGAASATASNLIATDRSSYAPDHREARAAGALESENIAFVIDFGYASYSVHRDRASWRAKVPCPWFARSTS